MLTAWKEMKDREAIIKEELRLFGNSEILEMLARGYDARINYDPNAGRVKYSSESCLPGRKEMAQFSLESGQMGYHVNGKNADGEKGATLEFLISSPEGTEIRISSTRRARKEIIARTTVEFPYALNLRSAYLLYRLANLYDMDGLEEFPLGLKPEQLKEYLKGYLSEETAADSNLGDKPQNNDIPKPFRRLLEDLGFNSSG